RNHEQPTSRVRFPKTYCSDQRCYDRQIRNRGGMNSMTHKESCGGISSSPKDCRNWPPRRRLVIGHRCHFVKQRIRLATQTTTELVQIKRPASAESPQNLSACLKEWDRGAADGASEPQQRILGNVRTASEICC